MNAIKAKGYSSNVTLKDGGSVKIRAIKPPDAQALMDASGFLATYSVYQNFFRTGGTPTEAEIKALCETNFTTVVSLVAVLREGGKENIIGIARFVQKDPGSAWADATLLVHEAHRGRGLGSCLLEHLSIIARDRGINELRAEVLGSSNRMLKVLSHIGCKVQSIGKGGVVQCIFQTEDAEEVERSREARDWKAAVESVRLLFQPRTVALVGASRREGSIGGQLLRNLQAAGFTGEIIAINPQTTEIGGLKCYPTLKSAGKPIDLAIVAVPAAQVAAVVEDCALAGVKSIVLISSGFGEVSEEGRAEQRRLVDLVRSSGMRMVGPNCLGIMNTDPAVKLNASFSPIQAIPGTIAMLTQSGALGIALLDYADKLGIGMSSFVSVGNKADFSGNDFIRYWSEDPSTNVIALYLESFGNPRRFGRIAPLVARSKPIVAVKSGRSSAGSRAASSHTASLASPDLAVDALFSESGVIRAETLEEMFDVVRLLARQPLPRGKNVAVVTNAGGPGILLADALEANGLKLPAFTGATLERLRSFLPPQAGLFNPVDMIASATPEGYAKTIETVAADESIDSVIVIYTPPFVSQIEDIARGIAEGAGKVPQHKPVQLVFLSSLRTPELFYSGKRGKLPVYVYPENAARALAKAERYGRWKERPVGAEYEPSKFQASAVRAVIDRAKANGKEWLSQEAITVILRALDIEQAAYEICKAEEAPLAAEKLGFPLVMKAHAAQILHKSELGGVILGIENQRDIDQALFSLRERMAEQKLELEHVFLQREIHGGIEMIAGVSVDPGFGPMVMAGFGGVQVELLKDVAVRLAPVSNVDAEEMLSQLRLRKLLDGYRGAPPHDRKGFCSLLMKLSALCELVPELLELDLNPVKVLPLGQGAVVVDARIRVG